LPFLKFSRDKRGIEHFSLVHTSTNRRGKVRPRVLYWYRSPPDVKVGREPFDPAMRRALEAQHPDIAFDWRTIVETPIPSADADKWRERRRIERAAKHAAAVEESADVETADSDVDELEVPAIDAVIAASDTAPDATSDAVPDAASDAASSIATDASAGPSSEAPRSGDRDRKRRRRRRSGGGRGGTPSASSTPGTGSSGD
jgi:hypothetical protein